MEFYSDRTRSIIILIGFIVGLLLFFNSSSILKYLTYTLLTVFSFGALWQLLFYLNNKKYGKAILPVLLILLIGGLLVIQYTGDFRGDSPDHKVFENIFNGELKEHAVTSNQPAWYWREQDISLEECYAMDDCETTARTESLIQSQVLTR